MIAQLLDHRQKCGDISDQLSELFRGEFSKFFVQGDKTGDARSMQRLGQSKTKFAQFLVYHFQGFEYADI